MSRIALVLSVSALLCSTALVARPARAEDDAPKEPAGTLTPADWLIVGSTDERGRQPFNPNALLRHHLLDPSAPAPKEGDELVGSSDTPGVWTKFDVTQPKAEPPFRVAAAYTNVRLEKAATYVVEVAGASTFWVNGAGYAGDGYRLRFRGVPVRLEKGDNHVFVQGIRGSFTMSLRPAAGDLVVADWDQTLPHAVRGRALAMPAAVPVLNCSDRPLAGITITAGGKRFLTRTRKTQITIPPYALVKVPFDLELASPATDGEETIPFEFDVTAADGTTARGSAVIKAFDPGEGHLRTFTSWIDGSTQRYAVKEPEERDGARVVLSLHGAGVRPMNQINSYARKPDLWTVAPTNRRPFGFDWQDWGRLDAYEVLADALALSGVSRDHVALTGHSMGGHGTWHLGANDPDRWVAIGPCAGWVSFDSYGGRPTGALSSMWHSADRFSDTLGLMDNLVQLPTYVHHGADDPTVPASEARRMIEAFAKRGITVASHFEPGAKHWWNRKETPGADCVDWAPMNDLFRTAPTPSERAARAKEIAFTTVDPAVDSRHHWLRVTQPREYGVPIRMTGRFDADAGRVTVTTHNARAIEVTAPAQGVSAYVIDGQEFPLTDPSAWFIRDGDAARPWRASVSAPSAGEKSPERCGPFKRAFDNRFVLVYPGGGSEPYRRAAYERARFDALIWQYRGNGLAELVSDRVFSKMAYYGYRGRNVIVYGNRDTNLAWRKVFDDDVIDVRDGEIRLGDTRYRGDDLGCVFVRPRKDDPQAVAAAIADTGETGCRAGYGLMPFISGVGYPDYTVFRADYLEHADGGVLAAGWFDHAWKLDGRGVRAETE